MVAAGSRGRRARQDRPARNAARSGGSSETVSIRSPLNGCGNASAVACRNCRSSARLADAVGRVAGDRQVDRREVDADLVHPARLEPHAQQRVLGAELLDLEVRRPRRAASRCRARSRVGSPRSRPIGASILPGARARPAAHEREVRALERALAHELAQRCVRLLRARERDQARRVAVEPVDDARPLRVAARDLARRARRRACRSRGPAPGWTTRPGRLVDDEHVLVLPDDARRRRARGSRGRRRDLGQLDLLAALQAVALRRARRRRRARRPRPPAPRPRASRAARRGSGRAARPPPPAAPSPRGDVERAPRRPRLAVGGDERRRAGSRRRSR